MVLRSGRCALARLARVLARAILVERAASIWASMYSAAPILDYADHLGRYVIEVSTGCPGRAFGRDARMRGRGDLDTLLARARTSQQYSSCLGSA
jgi:hypothetical protein